MPAREVVTCAVGMTKPKILTLLFRSEVPRGTFVLKSWFRTQMPTENFFLLICWVLDYPRHCFMHNCCRSLPCPSGNLRLRPLRLQETVLGHMRRGKVRNLASFSSPLGRKLKSYEILLALVPSPSESLFKSSDRLSYTRLRGGSVSELQGMGESSSG